MSSHATVAIALGVGLDLAFGEIPGRVHPVVAFGGLVERVDRAWPFPRISGGVVAVCLPLAAAVVVGVATAAAGQIRPILATAVAGVALFATTSLRMLLAAATDVAALTTTDLAAARESLRALAGRDAASLSPGEVRSAAIESVAENLADGFVAPLFAFVLGAQVSLAVAAAAATWVKAVNTLDSMLGYRSNPLGGASARLDDAVMWVPARVSAALLAVAGRVPAALVQAREWARAPSSPNSGWPMATLAVVLGVELRKPRRYALNPGAGLPTGGDVRRGVRTTGVAGLLATLFAGVIAWF